MAWWACMHAGSPLMICSFHVMHSETLSSWTLSGPWRAAPGHTHRGQPLGSAAQPHTITADIPVWLTRAPSGYAKTNRVRSSGWTIQSHVVRLAARLAPPPTRRSAPSKNCPLESKGRWETLRWPCLKHHQHP